jgi:hypothetical protein
MHPAHAAHAATHCATVRGAFGLPHKADSRAIAVARIRSETQRHCAKDIGAICHAGEIEGPARKYCVPFWFINLRNTRNAHIISELECGAQISGIIHHVERPAPHCAMRKRWRVTPQRRTQALNHAIGGRGAVSPARALTHTPPHSASKRPQEARGARKTGGCEDGEIAAAAALEQRSGMRAPCEAAPVRITRTPHARARRRSVRMMSAHALAPRPRPARQRRIKARPAPQTTRRLATRPRCAAAAMHRGRMGDRGARKMEGLALAGPTPSPALAHPRPRLRATGEAPCSRQRMSRRIEA